MQNFKNELDKLNDAQRQAVDTIEGPVMVIAGPGTGKTQILTLRIANILDKSDTEAENILAITFTESGVASMKKRLASLIGSPAYYVNITTFHSFANSIIFDNPDQFEHIIGSRPITELEQVQILEKIIENLPNSNNSNISNKRQRSNILKPFGDNFYYLKSILSSINNLKREAVSVAEFKKIVREEEQEFSEIEDLYHEKGVHKGKMKGMYQKELKNIEKNKELGEVFESYQKELEKQKLYDYSDMLIQVLEKLEEDEDLLFQIQEQYQYLLVDEHQDTNNAQNKILELLMSFHKNPNIFVVGDEKQAIYRFQGASLENFLYFQKLYPSASLIKLENNYRSSQTILDTAHSIKKSSIDAKVKLKAKSLHPEKQISLAVLESSDSENYFLAKSIQKKIEGRLSASARPVSGQPNAASATIGEIAVLYRDNRDALPIAYMLEKFEIPFAIESDQNIFEDEDIQKLLLLLETTNNFGIEELLARLMHADFLQIEAFDIYKAVAHAKKHNKKLLDLLKNKAALENLGLTSTDQMHSLYQKLSEWKRVSHFQNFAQLFETIVRDSGFLAHILSLPNSSDKLDKLNSLFNEVKSLLASHKEYLLPQFIDYINLLKNHDLLIKKERKQSKNKVRLMTAHKAKGMEFDIVYIANTYDGHWGNRRKRERIRLPNKVFSLISNIPTPPAGGFNISNAFDDERNLFYVAITRARKEVFISYAKKSSTKNLSASGGEQLPSQYITEIEPSLIKELDTRKIEEDFAKGKEILFAPSENSGQSISKNEKEFLNQLFLDRGLSVTAVNNYLACPWQYFFKNLVRLPQAKTKHMSYGTAVHEALHKTLEKVKGGQEPSKVFLLSTFEKELSNEPLSKMEFDELLEKGKEALNIYFDDSFKSWTKDALNEFNVKHIALQTEDGRDFSLNGKIDKIELNLKTGEANVVDYKTGKPKSTNVLQGKTKNSTGDYHRQLVFYKILLDRHFGEKKSSESSSITYNLKPTLFTIDFVEPNDKGKHISHKFEITESQAKELEQQLKIIAKEILDLDFWTRSCNNKVCQYCNLSKSIKI